MELELRERLGRVAEMPDDELGAFNLDIVDALDGLSKAEPVDETSGKLAGRIGELHALQRAAEVVDRQFATRERTALAASASPAPTNAVSAIAARQGHPRRSPEAAPTAPTRNRPVLTASAWLNRGSEPITDRMELAVAMDEAIWRMPRSGPPRGDVRLASVRLEYPEDRQLTDSAEHNAAIMDAVCAPAVLTASGGICMPTNVDYTLSTWATPDRPLRDGLPGFDASRGGLRYVQPFDIGALAGATGIWTEATDASPGASTKPIISVTCGTAQEVFVEAVTSRLGFGNMQARFAPEQIASAVDLTAAAAARIAENNLLNLIAAQCVQGVTTATVLGAARDVLTTLHQAVAAYRYAHRIPDTQAITMIVPDWLKGLIRVDLAREIGHAQNADWNSLMISDQQIDDLFTTAGVNPIWHLDGQPSSVSGGVAQTFAIQATDVPIETFPTKLVFYLFAEGQIQFLDGGRLDLGVVRDSTLDATNDFEMFQETFETVAFRGFASGAIQYVSTLCATGASTGTVAASAVSCA
jgi:hypothetical protein